MAVHGGAAYLTGDRLLRLRSHCPSATIQRVRDANQHVSRDATGVERRVAIDLRVTACGVERVMGRGTSIH